MPPLAPVAVTTRHRSRIAIFIPSLETGGAERVTATLVSNLDLNRYDVDVVLLSRPAAFSIPPAARVIVLGAPNVTTALPELVLFLRRSPPDVLLANMTLPNVWALIARRIARASVPIVCIEHNVPTISHAAGTPVQRLLPRLIRRTYGDADRIVAVSNAVKADLEALLGPRGPTIDVIYNPVVSPTIHALATEDVEHPWFSSHELRVLLAVGRLHAQKNFALLLESFALVAAQAPDTRLVIIGDGPEKSQLLEQHRALGLETRVDFIGVVANPYKYMSRARVLVMSSRWEGLPTVAIEALACGTPVVSTSSAGGISEIVGDGEWGRIVPAGDAAMLAEAIVTELGDARDRAELRARGESFSVERATAAYENLIDALLAKPAPHGRSRAGAGR